MFDLPEPLGPTTAVMPCSKRRVVGDAKDLKPFSVRLLRYTACQTTAQIARSNAPRGCRPLELENGRETAAGNAFTEWHRRQVQFRAVEGARLAFDEPVELLRWL
jgi:hypothetical protein